MTPEYNQDGIQTREVYPAKKKTTHTAYILVGLAVLVIFVALIIVSVMKRNPMKQALLTEPVFDSQNTVTTGTDEYNKGVFVDTVDVMIMESFPVQAQALVRGNLADGCTVIADTAVRRDGMMLYVDIRTTRQSEMCTQVLVPFERSVTLPVAGLAAGTYTVSVAGISKSFTLAMNNTPIFESDK